LTGPSQSPWIKSEPHKSHSFEYCCYNEIFHRSDGCPTNNVKAPKVEMLMETEEARYQVTSCQRSFPSSVTITCCVHRTTFPNLHSLPSANPTSTSQ